MKIYLCFLLIVLWKIEANAAPSPSKFYCVYLIYILAQTQFHVFFYSEITNPPVSVSAYFDTWVSFHCEGEGEVLLWQTNGELLTDEIKESRNITIHPGITTPGVVNSTLAILAKPEPWHNGLNIGCVVGNHGSFDFDSAGANLFVKGNDTMIYICFFRIKIIYILYFNTQELHLLKILQFMILQEFHGIHHLLLLMMLSL